MAARYPHKFLDRDTPPHLATLVVLAGMSAAAMNMFLPSLPAMAEQFDTGYGVVQLSVTLYLAVNAVLQLFIGPLSDRLGRRPVLLWSLALFVGFSFAIPFSPSVEVYLTLRMGQAVVVATMVLSRAIVRDVVPQNEAASMIGYVTMGMALVPMLAPMLGGAIDQLLGWEWTFHILGILGLGALYLTWADLGETATPGPNALADQMREAPELLRSPRFWGYNFAAMFSSGAFFAYLGGAPYVGTEVFSLSPLMLGILLGSPAVGYMAGNAISGAYSIRRGINAMILTGTLLCCTGLGLSLILSLAGWHNPWVFFGFTTFVGLGNGLVLPNATAGMLSVRPRLAGTASGLGGAMMIGGGAALSALAAAVLVPGRGAYPLIWMMFVTSVLSVLSILYVIRRARQVGATDPSDMQP
ncbi:multidrug effflux MFS transporter [Meridianimarinicoccus sp. MJW13]|uniref:multidrug effflux MFS transporter n=1 Tax=Meridianimarinicoccus sp. MJW13 TaxID=2720031 RepID=UPI001865F733|nr:multidrug effflux MFS transporter [Fluviibacterium sp. MJW13]